MPPEPDHGDMYGISAAPPPAGRGNTPKEAHSAQPQTAPPAGRAVPGLTPEAADLWNTVVKKAVGEKPMLIRNRKQSKTRRHG